MVRLHTHVTTSKVAILIGPIFGQQWHLSSDSDISRQIIRYVNAILRPETSLEFTMFACLMTKTPVCMAFAVAPLAPRVRIILEKE